MLIIAGIILIAISKVLILWSLFGQEAHDNCTTNAAVICPDAPFPFFIYGWIITAAGAAMLIYGMKYVSLKDLR
jgi:hypothetical protein